MTIKPPKGMCAEELIREIQGFFNSFGIRDIIVNFNPKTGLIVVEDKTSWRRGFNFLHSLLSSRYLVVSCQEPEHSFAEIYDMSNLPGVDSELVGSLITKGQELSLIKKISREESTVQAVQI